MSWSSQQEAALKAVVASDRAYERREPMRDVVMQQIASYEAVEMPSSQPRGA